MVQSLCCRTRFVVLFLSSTHDVLHLFIDRLQMWRDQDRPIQVGGHVLDTYLWTVCLDLGGLDRRKTMASTHSLHISRETQATRRLCSCPSLLEEGRSWLCLAFPAPVNSERRILCDPKIDLHPALAPAPSTQIAGDTAIYQILDEVRILS